MLPNPIRIRVGLPSIRKPLPAQTEQTLKALQSYNNIQFEIKLITGTHCVRARNIAALAIPKNGLAEIKQVLPYDYYLSMDDDMAFTPETVERLIAADKNIIGAAYSSRQDNSEIIAAPLDSNYVQERRFKIWDSGIQECLWVGAGCLLIKKAVFEMMDYPYFRNNILTIDGKSDVCTEDIGFAQDAIKLGFKVYVDLDNKVAHLST